MNVYEIITARILVQLEQGVILWHRPWRSRSVPKNLLSQKPYRGVNIWLLVSQPYTSPYWLTFVQAQEIGGRVRSGEKGTPVIFWKRQEETQEEEIGQGVEGKRRAPLLRYYTIFNIDQCELPASLTARLSIPSPVRWPPFLPVNTLSSICRNGPRSCTTTPARTTRLAPTW